MKAKTLEPFPWPDRPANTEHRIQALLSHPYRMARQLPFVLNGQTDGQRRSSIVGFLQQFEDAVRKGPDDLDSIVADFIRVGMGKAGYNERSRARSIYEELRGWAMIERHRRTSPDHDVQAPDLDLPEHVQALMVELDSIGLTLRGKWREGFALQQELARHLQENRNEDESTPGETQVSPPAIQVAPNTSIPAEVQSNGGVNNVRPLPPATRVKGNAVDDHEPLPWATPSGRGRLVVGWKAILFELKVPYERKAKDWMKRENDRSRGPIVRNGKTVQVFDDQLKAWWMSLTDRAAAAGTERESRLMQGSDHPLELQSQGMRRKTERGRAGRQKSATGDESDLE